jgi:hypothetical protein
MHKTNKKIYKAIHMKYDSFFSAHFLDKPLYKINDDNEKCIYITDDEVIVKNIFDKKPIDIVEDDIYFYKLDDRDIYISLQLFLK